MSLERLCAAVRLLAQTEELAADATGGLLYAASGAPVGSVLIEAGRICWIAAKGLNRRLSGLLMVGASEADRERFESIFEWCREKGAPLGETLLQHRLVDEAGLREAILRHSAESLLSLAPVANEVQWVEHQRRRYDARFTFCATELFVTAAALVLPEEARAGRAHLERVLRGSGAGIAIVKHPESGPVCVAQVRGDHWSVSMLERLASYAALAYDLLDSVSPEHGAMTIGATLDTGLTVWRHEDLLYVSATEDAGHPSLRVASLSGTLALLGTDCRIPTPDPGGTRHD